MKKNTLKRIKRTVHNSTLKATAIFMGFVFAFGTACFAFKQTWISVGLMAISVIWLILFCLVNEDKVLRW